MVVLILFKFIQQKLGVQFTVLLAASRARILQDRLESAAVHDAGPELALGRREVPRHHCPARPPHPGRTGQTRASRRGLRHAQSMRIFF